MPDKFVCTAFHGPPLTPEQMAELRESIFDVLSQYQLRALNASCINLFNPPAALIELALAKGIKKEE